MNPLEEEAYYDLELGSLPSGAFENEMGMSCPQCCRQLTANSQCIWDLFRDNIYPPTSPRPLVLKFQVQLKKRNCTLRGITKFQLHVISLLRKSPS